VKLNAAWVGPCFLREACVLSSSLVGTPNLTPDLLAVSVWHIGLFIVATARHGSGRRRGVAEVRKRDGVQMGRQVNALRVMAKPLAGGTLEQHTALVSRDRPES
jgi:hypothetical protein